jgi:hypothetical protein
MTAARIARRQEQAEPAPRRDVIGEILFWKLDWFEAHPLICFAGIILTIVINGVLERLP